MLLYDSVCSPDLEPSVFDWSTTATAERASLTVPFLSLLTPPGLPATGPCLNQGMTVGTGLLQAPPAVSEHWGRSLGHQDLHGHRPLMFWTSPWASVPRPSGILTHAPLTARLCSFRTSVVKAAALGCL